MVGSHAPRPTKGLALRTGRPVGVLNHPAIMEEREEERTDALDLRDRPSTLYVEGRVTVEYWNRHKRLKKRDLEVLLREFGLILCEVAGHGGRTRNTVFTKRVPTNEIYAEIFDHPGISFERWLTRCYPLPDDADDRMVRANRARAASALTRLCQSGHVRRLHNADGLQILWPMRFIGERTPLPIPDELRELRSNQ